MAGDELRAAVPHPVDRLPVPSAKPRRQTAQELRIGAATVLVCLVLGLVMAALWAWLAPKVPLVVDGRRVLYGDPEGEQRAGADSVFALLGLGMGLLTALGAFLLTRSRGGGIAVAVGLAVGGLLGSLGACWLGVRLGPDANLLAQASRAGDGGHFDADLRLGAQAALLVWPMAAMVLLLALSAAFGKREEDLPPYWAGPDPAREHAEPWQAQAPQSGQAQQSGPAPQDAPPQGHERP